MLKPKSLIGLVVRVVIALALLVTFFVWGLPPTIKLVRGTWNSGALKFQLAEKDKKIEQFEQDFKKLESERKSEVEKAKTAALEAKDKESKAIAEVNDLRKKLRESESARHKLQTAKLELERDLTITRGNLAEVQAERDYAFKVFKVKLPVTLTADNR